MVAHTLALETVAFNKGILTVSVANTSGLRLLVDTVDFNSLVLTVAPGLYEGW